MSGLEPQPSRQLYLNSRNASYVQDPTRNSRLSFNLNEPIVCPKGHEFYASIVSAEIPNTLYSINPGDTIVFNWYKSGALAGSTTFTCATTVATNPAPANANLVIPAGNYSGTTNSTVLATYLSKTTLAFDATTITFTTTYDTATSRFRIAWTSAANTYSLAINSVLLGFNIANTSATALATPIVASTLPRLFPNYILIGSNLNSYNQAVGQSLIPALAKITIDVPFNSWIYFRNWFLYTTRITNREIFNLEITLYDEFGQLLNLNSGHFSFTIQIDTKQMITNSLGTGNF
jgi:hypothetical protein